MTKDPITAQVIIGTPGKIEDLIGKRLLNTKGINLLVLDEADQLLDQGNQTLRIQIEKIRKLLNKNLRIFLFSATYAEKSDGSDEGSIKDAKILEFAERFVPNPKEKILVPKTELSLEGIRQYSIICKPDEKVSLLENIFSNLPIAQCMIFVRTISGAKSLASTLRKKKSHNFITSF